MRWSAIRATVRARVLAAASSMARGRPSRRRQIDRTGSPSSSRSLNSGRARRARSVKSSTESASVSGGTAHVTSPPTSSGSLLVATILSSGAAASSSAAISAADSTRCSQLSSTTSARRTDRWRPTASARVRPDPGSFTRRASATCSQANCPPDRGEKSTNQTPSGNCSATTEASWIASRVLPAPPAPVRVSSRASTRRAAAFASSASRPTKRVSGVGSVKDTICLRVEPESPTIQPGSGRKEQPAADRKINQVVDVGCPTSRDPPAMHRAMLTTIGIPLSVATSADAIRCDLLKRWGGEDERSQILRFVQPSLIGLIDGTISTLAPIFAAAFLAGSHAALLVGLAASLGAAISMGLSEALSDDGELSGRGNSLVRGALTGLATFVGGTLHALPFLISDTQTALKLAYVVVGLELITIAWVRRRFLQVPLHRSLVQVTMGGFVVAGLGAIIGHA